MKEQTLKEEIASLPHDKQYTPILNFPIPLRKSVIVKPAKKEVIVVEGIIIPDTAAENTQMPKVGILYAVGPECSPHMRIGLRVMYNHYADLGIKVGVEKYIMMDENDVYFILRDNQTVSQGAGVKPAKEVRRAKKIDQTDSYYVRKDTKEANDKDKKLDKTKGKIFAISKK